MIKMKRFWVLVTVFLSILVLGGAAGIFFLLGPSFNSGSGSPAEVEGPQPVDWEQVLDRFSPVNFSLSEGGRITPADFSITIGEKQVIGSPVIISELDDRYLVTNDFARDILAVRTERISLVQEEGDLSKQWDEIAFGGIGTRFPEDPHVIEANVLYGAGGIYPLHISLRWIKPASDKLEDWAKALTKVGFVHRDDDDGTKGPEKIYVLSGDGFSWIAQVRESHGTVQGLEISGSMPGWYEVIANIGRFYSSVNAAIEALTPVDKGGWIWRRPAPIPNIWVKALKSFGTVSEASLVDWGFPGSPPISDGVARVWNPGMLLVDVSLVFPLDSADEAWNRLSDIYGIDIPEDGNVETPDEFIIKGERRGDFWRVRIEDKKVRMLALAGDMAFGGLGFASDIRNVYLDRLNQPSENEKPVLEDSSTK